jgi:pyruvate dehydrogenase E2 component (dihydrolipoamide acetyltransferase)
VLTLARELATLTARARDNRLEPADLADATFTVASLVDAGGTGFTPIIPGPAVAILGITRSHPKLVERKGHVATRLMLPLSLSYHRGVIDSTAAACFTACVASLLGDLRRVSL